MAQEFYIDENGNKIPISGTVTSADMLPMSASDSTKVSEAIGTLSSLKTTHKNSLVNAVNDLAELRVWTTSTTSFNDACSKIGIYYGIGNALDNIKNNIASYSDGINSITDTSQGPNFFAWLGKANNNYWTGMMLSYFYNDTSRQPVLFTYSNGTYAVRRL